MNVQLYTYIYNDLTNIYTYEYMYAEPIKLGMYNIAIHVS